jgi:TolB-like protein/DNA-binding winged helix-turn-helix (wHTH) protein
MVRFGVFELDLIAGELRRNGRKIKLQEQPFEILSLLLEHPGEVVTQEQIIAKLWADGTVVEYEHSIRTAVKKLRQALSDEADTPRYVETLPRRGYRFIALVNGADVAASVKETRRGGEMPTRSRWFHWTTAILSLVALASTLFTLNAFRVRDRLLGSTSVPRIQSLAVLPLTNLSGDPAQEYFSDGMTDALITELAEIGSLKVISRTSSMRYKQTKKSLAEIARELNVDGIVEGTVQRSGDRVRITAQLIYGPTDKHLWAASYERNLDDVFVLEGDVAGDVAHQVQARVTTQNEAPVPASPTPPQQVNLKALEAYLQGNYHLNRFSRGSGDEEKRRANVYFQQAIDADPRFALAYNGMAKAHYDLLRSSGEDVASARRAAGRAVELDPTLSDAWTTLGNLKFERDWDWAGAEQDYRRAIALNPNYADAHDEFSDLLHATGRLDEGWKESQIAQELDPLNDHLSKAFEWRGQYDRAIEVLVGMIRSHPEDGFLHLTLYQCYGRKGMYKESVQELEKAATLFGLPEAAASVHRSFAAGGYPAAMREWAMELEHWAATRQVFAPFGIAEGYAAAGDKDRAFYWLERAYKDREMSGIDTLPYLGMSPLLEPLRSDPRYKDLLRRVGLPP